MKVTLDSAPLGNNVLPTVPIGGPSRPRDPSLDFAKGLLVEVMILFHGLQYFLGPRFEGLDYLAFVTGAFVFLAGALVTEIYSARFKTSPGSTFLHLVWRGGKLLVLFSAINLAFRLFVPGSQADRDLGLLAAAREIFGPGNKTMVIFEMLVPIAYTLIVAAAFGALARKHWVMAVISVGAFVMLTTYASQSFNIYFLGLGLLGLAYGLLKRYRGPGPAGYVIAAVAAIGAAAYFVSVALMPEDTPWIYAAGVVVTVEMFRSLRLYLPLPMSLSFTMEEFGRYSLFAYIAQIAFLRVLLAVIGAEAGAFGYAFGPIIACNLVLIGTMLAMSRLRLAYPWFDTSYRAIFG